MIPFLIEFLILVILAVVVFYFLRWLLDQAEADLPIKKIVLLIALIIFLVALANLLTGHSMWGPIIPAR